MDIRIPIGALVCLTVIQGNIGGRLQETIKLKQQVILVGLNVIGNRVRTGDVAYHKQLVDGPQFYINVQLVVLHADEWKRHFGGQAKPNIEGDIDFSGSDRRFGAELVCRVIRTRVLMRPTKGIGRVIQFRYITGHVVIQELFGLRKIAFHQIVQILPGKLLNNLPSGGEGHLFDELCPEVVNPFEIVRTPMVVTVLRRQNRTPDGRQGQD